MKEKILSAIESPKELEILYQQNPEEFQKAFPDVFAKHPDTLVLQVWHERINYVHSSTNQQKVDIGSYKKVFLIILLSAIGGTILNLPLHSQTIDIEWFYNRNFAGILIISLMIYFFFQRVHSWKSVVILLGIASGALLYLNLLPNEYSRDIYRFYEKYRAFRDALTLAELHMPLFLWLLLGVALTGKNWKESSERMNYLRYNGELIIYTTLIVIGGTVLTGITMALLSLIEKSYELTGWYMENIIMYEIVAAPIVSTFLTEKIIGRRLNIAPVLAKFFTPLFLLTTIVYLIIMAVYQKNPYNDREYLIAFNILLITVLGLLIFSIAERDPKSPTGINDYMNIGLILTTLIIDLIALSAVLFRLSNDIYGLTPNRIAILGINLLVCGHLVGILIYYIRFMTNKSPFIELENWITRYLAVYAVWAMAVSIALPLFFWYR